MIRRLGWSTPTGETIPSPPTCIENIGPLERRKRLLAGVAALVLGAALAWLPPGDALWWRLTLFVPFWGGALGILQALDRT